LAEHTRQAYADLKAVAKNAKKRKQLGTP